MNWNTLPPAQRELATQILTERQLAILQDRINGHPWRTIAAAHNIHEATARGHWNAAIKRIAEHQTQHRKDTAA